jgi:hypothetical protein
MLQYLSLFQNSVSDARGMISTAHQKDASGAHLWHSAARSMFVESSFMKIFLSWETFLESTFIDYMLGKPSIGATILTRHVSPKNAGHANDMLHVGGHQRHVDWSTPDAVRRMSRVCFDEGEPYESVLSSINSDLLDLKTIRNAASHASRASAAALDGLATRKLQVSVSGITAAELLLASDPASATQETVLSVYCGQLDSAATLIANA